MTARSDDSLATILLVSRLLRDGAKPLNAAEYWRLCEQVGPPSVLLGQSEKDIVQGLGLREEVAGRVVRLLSRAVAMAFELEKLDHAGIGTPTRFDEGYPERFVRKLGDKAPALLHVAGSVGLLSQSGAGVVGSRDISPDGAEVAKAAAQRIARLGYVLVSGGARGVDQLAMNAAMAAGGGVVGVLAASLLRTLRTPDVRRAIHEGSTAMVTPYSPNASFNPGNAMGRNKLIYALAKVTLAVACEPDRGGTWSGAVEALRIGAGRVAVWRGRGEGPGNEELAKRGAHPVGSADDLERLLEGQPELDPPDPVAPVGTGRSVQASLFDGMG